MDIGQEMRMPLIYLRRWSYRIPPSFERYSTMSWHTTEISDVGFLPVGARVIRSRFVFCTITSLHAAMANLEISSIANICENAMVKLPCAAHFIIPETNRQKEPFVRMVIAETAIPDQFPARNPKTPPYNFSYPSVYSETVETKDLIYLSI